MPGRQFLNQLEKRLEQLGGEDYLFDRIASGERLKDIAADLGCSRPYLYKWRDREPFKDRRRERWSEAMRLSGEAKLEEGEEILDGLADTHKLITSADVSVGVARSNYRKWMAQVRDPEQFGDRSNGAGMILNVGVLHLDALRSAGSRPQVGPVVEADVVAIEEGAEVEDNEVVKALKG